MSDDMHSLSEHLSLKDDAGRVVVQVALLASFYFENGHTRETREAIAQCSEEYLKLCGQHIRWVLVPDRHTTEAFASSQFASPGSWIAQRGEDKGMEMVYHGGPYKKGASAFMIEAMTHEKRREGELGYFRIAFPLTWFLDRDDRFSDLVLRLCRSLRPLSGYGGIGLVESIYSEVAMYFEPYAFRMAMRFPGLEVDYPTGHANWLEHGIKGVNWLTIVGDRWLAKLGGAEALTRELAELDSRFAVHSYGKGLMIQAGPRPQLGDAERDLWPELYVKLAKKLKPIRVKEHGAFHFGAPLREPPGTPRFDADLSEAWLRRFDDR